VLVYHGVGEATEAGDPNRMITPPALVASHVRLLRRLGYRFVTAEQALDASNGGGPPAGTAVLTFDDGFRDWVTDALPLLRLLDVPATFYLCPGWLGGRHPDVPGAHGRLLDEGEARQLVAEGMELGSHAMAHEDLRELDDGALHETLRASRTAVQELSGRPCRTLAYPFGLFGDREARAAADAGYELAFAWRPGPWRPLAAPRLPAPPRHGAVRLAAKLVGVRRRTLG
jgi:peptidoglycan/xylan/chitin deacetylase (PgdA/CDA1 family)